MRRTRLRHALAHTLAVSAVSTAALGACAHAQTSAPAQSADSARTPPAAEAAASAANPAALDAVADASVTTGVGELLVTARRTKENAQEVPIALSVLSSATLTQTGSYTLADLQAQTPSFTAYQTNARNSSVGIRGIGVSSASDGLDSSVGVYVDNVYLGRPGMALEDLIDVDRVEVLRGPQGTLFGRNSSAGVLNVTTKAPSFSYGANLEGTIGDYGYNQERISVTGPLVKDLLAFRLTLFNTHRDGYVPNPVTGIAGNSVERHGGRLQFLYTPSSRLSVRLIAEYSNENDTCCVSVINAAAPGSIAATTARTLQAFAGLGYTPVRDLANSYTNAPQNMLTDQHSASAEVNWDLGWADLTSITAYRYWHFDPLQDSDGTPLDIIQVNVAQTKDQQYSQEFRLSSKPGRRLSWQAGVYLFDQHLKDHYILNQFGRDASAFYTAYLRTANPNAAAVSIAPGSQYIEDTVADTKSAAVFGQANYKITDRLTVTGGIRYTHDDKHGISDTSTYLTPYAATSILFHYNVTVKDDNVSWLGSVSYKLTPSALLYASYSTGYKSAGLNLNSAVTAGTPLVLDPEHVRDWEAGLKQTLLGGHLVFNVGGYIERLTGLQANIYPTNGAKSYLANVGDVSARGAEAEADLYWGGLTLNLNGSYNDAHYTSYANGPCPVGVTGVCDLTGRPVYEAPRWIWNATARYQWDLGGVRPYVQGQVSHRSSAFGTVDDGPNTVIPGYTLVNLRVGTEFGDGRYDVSLWLNNATAERYFLTMGTASIPGAGTFAFSGQPGVPRTYGATLRASF